MVEEELAAAERVAARPKLKNDEGAARFAGRPFSFIASIRRLVRCQGVGPVSDIDQQFRMSEEHANSITPPPSATIGDERWSNHILENRVTSGGSQQVAAVKDVSGLATRRRNHLSPWAGLR
jgi:hypothetical protein